MLDRAGVKQTYQTAVPQAGIAYASSSYGDMAALFLAWATNSSDYYSQAETYNCTRSIPFAGMALSLTGIGRLLAQLANSGANFAGNLSG
jgi:endoglucanase